MAGLHSGCDEIELYQLRAVSAVLRVPPVHDKLFAIPVVALGDVSEVVAGCSRACTAYLLADAAWRGGGPPLGPATSAHQPNIDGEVRGPHSFVILRDQVTAVDIVVCKMKR